MLKESQLEQEMVASLWPHVLSALLRVHGNLEAARLAAEKLGCPWNSLNEEERQYELAKFHVSRHQIDKAREDLAVLPPETFAERKGVEALKNDNGAAFGAWISRGVAHPESYAANHVLLEWLLNEGTPEEIESVGDKLEPTDPQKIMAFLEAAERYKIDKNGAKLTAVLKKCDTLISSFPDGQLRGRLGAVMLVQRVKFEGRPAVKVLKDSGILEKYKDEPWLTTAVPDLIEADELPLAEQLAAHHELNDRIRAVFAMALAKAGRDEEAMQQAAMAKELLGPARVRFGIGLSQHIRGDDKAARKTLLEAIDLAQKVKATNKWSPNPDEVNLNEQSHVLTKLYVWCVESGGVNDVFAKYEGRGSIRAIARFLAAQGDIEKVRKWIDGFSERRRSDGDRCYALLGLAEGLAYKTKTP